MVEMKNLDVKQYFTVLMAIIVLTALTIFLNIPFLRQVLGFLCFTTVPGLLIIHILKLNKIEFLKKFVLSVGLSVAFLMFGGLFVNSFYPLILKPLSLAPILLSFNIILIILAFIAYKRNEKDFDIKDVFNFKLDLKGKLTSPLIFPVLFPFMAVFGTYLMNTEGNNIILLAMLFLIPTYVVAVVILRDKTHDATYPVAVWMIGMSLLLMHSLVSNHISMGYNDIDLEYYLFRSTANNFHWDVSKYYSSYNACLSVTILPAIYKVLSNINGEYIYKLLFQLIFSITPLVVYLLFKKYVSNSYAFLASFFFMAQIPFIENLPSHTRTEIAFVFFALAMLVFFDDKIDGLNKRILFLIFMFSVIVSHYTTAYIFLFLVIGCWLMVKLIKSLQSYKSNITLTISILFFTVIFFWYSQVTEVSFNAGVNFLEQTFRNLGNFFVEELRGGTELKIIGIGLEETSQKISSIVHIISFIFITVGLFGLLRKYKESKFGIEYISVTIVCEALLFSELILPFVSTGFSAIRLYLMALILMSPLFFMGGEFIIKTIADIVAKLTNKSIKSKVIIGIVIVVLISQFICGTSLIYVICGTSQLAYQELSSESKYRQMYIYDQDVMAASWLVNTGVHGSTVYTDFMGDARLIVGGCSRETFNIALFNEDIHRRKRFKILKFVRPKEEVGKDDYIYLRYKNVIDGEVSIDASMNTINISEVSHLFIGKGKVYNNGGAEVWK